MMNLQPPKTLLLLSYCNCWPMICEVCELKKKTFVYFCLFIFFYFFHLLSHNLKSCSFEASFASPLFPTEFRNCYISWNQPFVMSHAALITLPGWWLHCQAGHSETVFVLVPRKHEDGPKLKGWMQHFSWDASNRGLTLLFPEIFRECFRSFINSTLNVEFERRGKGVIVSVLCDLWKGSLDSATVFFWL